MERQKRKETGMERAFLKIEGLTEVEDRERYRMLYLLFLQSSRAGDEKIKKRSLDQMEKIFSRKEGEEVFLFKELVERIEGQTEEERPKCARESYREVLGVREEKRAEEEEIRGRKFFKELEPYISEKKIRKTKIPKKEKKKIREARDKAQTESRKQVKAKRQEDREYAQEMKRAEKKMRQG